MLCFWAGQIIQREPRLVAIVFFFVGWMITPAATDCHHKAQLQLQQLQRSLSQKFMHCRRPAAGKCNNKSHFMRLRRRNRPFYR